MTSPSIPRPLLSVPLTQRRAAAEWEALGVVCPSCHGRLGDATEAAWVGDVVGDEAEHFIGTGRLGVRAGWKEVVPPVARVFARGVS